MTILVDMDDVLECLVEGWCRLLNEQYGTSVTRDDVKDWNISLAFPELTREQVYAPELEDELWDYVLPMPGADEALHYLMDKGHEIIVVTATEYQSLRAKMEKVLFRYFPYLTWDRVIITSRKYLIKGDVLIDDGPHNLMGTDCRKILFDCPHNRAFDEHSVGAVRAKDWQDICRIIDEWDK